METFENFQRDLYSVNEHTFDDIALQLFKHQAVKNPVYSSFLTHLRVSPTNVSSILEIPFLPISFFKQHTVKTGAWADETIFSSSGTTGQKVSQHHVRDLNFYLNHSKACFSHFFGPLDQYHFLALLPSYLERSGSSLVAMMDYFISESKSSYSGFYLNNIDQLLHDAESLKGDKRKIIVWGVSFALLDLALNRQPDLHHCMIFETGGMKGKRREMTKNELHTVLTKGLNVSSIHSEYGMTELFSQGYSVAGERFSPSPWMKVIGREITDPMQKGLLRETSGINVIDLANWHSIAFIETEDLGKIYEDGTFDIMGRMDNSDVRGCNLMVQ